MLDGKIAWDGVNTLLRDKKGRSLGRRSSILNRHCGGKLEGYRVGNVFSSERLDLFQLGVSIGSSAVEGYVRSSWFSEEEEEW